MHTGKVANNAAGPLLGLKMKGTIIPTIVDCTAFNVKFLKFWAKELIQIVVTDILMYINDLVIY